MSLFPGIEKNPNEVDLNDMEDAVASAAQSVLNKQEGLRVEVVPSLPQMLTPAFYLSSENPPHRIAFGRVVPAASFFVVGVDQKLQTTLDSDTNWIIETIESAWHTFFPNVSCQLGAWESDLTKLQSLPPMLNLRFMRFSVFRYRDGRPEPAGYFDILGKYREG
jgi:hypothetical protein